MESIPYLGYLRIQAMARENASPLWHCRGKHLSWAEDTWISMDIRLKKVSIIICTL
jgi:hypothetical protein